MIVDRCQNRLVEETSPYLLQHAHNPVDWYPWGEEALTRSRTEDLPIFLSVGYSACHWCHVMAHECFENEAIAGVMNRHFVNIKVDREERPDLDEIYMHAVQAMTGSGGWPMSVFLTPELEPFYGGTYFPPEDRHGRPGFSKILLAVSRFYETRKEEARAQGRKMRDYLAQASLLPAAEEPPEASLLESAYRALSRGFDHQNGGFGAAPKFPGSMNLAFFLRRHRRTGDAGALEMVTHACRRMAAGGIYDHLGGGFHRYSVDERWLVPHFEKMLYDNALLSQLYLEAYQVTREPDFRTVVEETLDYVLREMTSSGGGFHSTQDADSEGEEGKFFVWTPEEVEEALGEEQVEVFCRYFDVTPHGNFEHGRSILNTPLAIEAVARRYDMDPGEVREILREGRRTLFRKREERVKPGLDDKVQTSWNGLMISSLARAFTVLEENRYRIAAEGAARFLLDHLVKDGRLLHSSRGERSRLNGFLDDYAFFIGGLIDLYEATFDPEWLNRARDLTETMVDLFWDPVDGALYFTARDHEALLVRSKHPYDNAIPSGNAAAVHALIRLSALLGRPDYAEKAGRILKAFAGAMRQTPTGFPHMLCALDLHLGPLREVAIAGSPDHPATRALLTAARAGFDPHRVVGLWDPALGPGRYGAIKLLEGKTPLEGRPAAYVCRDSSCSPPVTDPESLRSLLA